MSTKLMARMTRMIKLTDEVHKKLLEMGAKSETFSDIIDRLIEHYKKTKK